VCAAPSCGDNVTNGTEACDPGGGATPVDTATCDDDCTLVDCGDGHPNAPALETCDDGNGNNFDDCPDGPTGSCLTASCNDGFLHDQGTGTETDVDCGGSCPGCGNGKFCLVNEDCASGACVGILCAAPAVVSTTPASNATDVDVSATIQVTFNAAMDPASLTLKTTLDAGACSGSIQVSTDGFATCIPFATATPAMSAGDTVATLDPAPGLSFGSSYQIKVTTAAQSATLAPLGSEFLGGAFATMSGGCSGGLVVSQVYGGGGNTGAPYTHDFIEIHNRSVNPIPLTGYSVQYASAAGTTWSMTPLGGTIAPGGYFLIQEGSGGAVGAPLPTADHVAALPIAMAAGSGKVALVLSTTPLSGACPTANVVDLVGYGTANCFEGAAASAALSNTTSAQRKLLACSDTNDNAADFSVRPTAPRNAASPGTNVVNETGVPSELDYCNVQFPLSLTAPASSALPTVYSRVFENGITPPAGPHPIVAVEFGYGPRNVNPQHEAGFTFFPAVFNVQVANDDEYQIATNAPATAGSYSYLFRVSLDSGASWTYCDLDGSGSNAGLFFETTRLPLLDVTP
jgi:hypothetical protein